MDDAALVKTVAEQYLRDMGSRAIPYLREMQEFAASLADHDSARAWRDIADAVQVILLPGNSAQADPEPKPRSAAFMYSPSMAL